SEKLIDEIARPLSRPADRIEIANRVAVGCELRFRQLRMAENCAQDIVEVVRDAAGEGTHRLHAAGLLQACLQARSFTLQGSPPEGADNGIERVAQQAELVGSGVDRDLHSVEAQNSDAPLAGAADASPA